jgi:hypothetical protein
MKASGVTAFGVKRRAVDRDNGVVRLLVLVPTGSIVMAGLLIIALSRTAGTPAIPPSQSSTAADAEGQVEARTDGPLITEDEVREMMASPGLAVTR